MKGDQGLNNSQDQGLFNRVFDSILNGGKFIGMIMVLIAMLGLCIHVFMRYFFNSPINWMVDISTLFMFYITFLGSAWLLARDGHVSLDFLYHTIGPVKFKRVQAFFNFVCAIVCFIVVYFGIMETILTIQLELVVDMPLAPPKWIVLSIIPVGFFFLGVEFLRKVVFFFKEKDSSKSN